MKKWLAILVTLLTQTALASELSLNSYLDQVRGNEGDYKAAAQTTEAAQLYGREAHLMLSTNFFANATYSDDKKPSTFISYDDLVTKSYQAGFSQNTSFGLSGKLYYTVLDQAYHGYGFAGLPPALAAQIPALDPHYLQASPVLELTFPLWRNWLGAETKSQIAQGDADKAVKQFDNSYKMKSLLAQAETAYWSLALARESVKVSKDAVARSNQLYQWHERRAKLGLADRADLLQAQAALELHKIDLKTGQDNEQTAARAFNSSRGVDSSEVSEGLSSLDSEQIRQIAMPPRQGDRDDIKSAYEHSLSTKAGAELSRQKYLPTFEIVGSKALNNPDPNAIDSAYADSFQTSRPTDTIGIRFNAPLDFGLIHDVRQGWEKEKYASEYTYQRKRFSQDNEWNDLTEKFNQAKTRFELYRDLENVQKVKLDYERDRRLKGRTTTQQVLQFEVDYESAQLGRIRTLSEMLQVLAQMKIFNGEQNESR